MFPGDEEEFVPDGCYYPQLCAVVGVDGVQMTAWEGHRDGDIDTDSTVHQTRALLWVVFSGIVPQINASATQTAGMTPAAGQRSCARAAERTFGKGRASRCRLTCLSALGAGLLKGQCGL